MIPDTFIGLTEEKIKRIVELPYILLAKQISEQEGVDISIEVTVRKKASWLEAYIRRFYLWEVILDLFYF